MESNFSKLILNNLFPADDPQKCFEGQFSDHPLSADQGQARCAAAKICLGIEYSAGRCEIWQKEVATTTPTAGYTCLRYQPPTWPRQWVGRQTWFGCGRVKDSGHFQVVGIVVSDSGRQDLRLTTRLSSHQTGSVDCKGLTKICTEHRAHFFKIMYVKRNLKHDALTHHWKTYNSSLFPLDFQKPKLRICEAGNFHSLEISFCSCRKTDSR